MARASIEQQKRGLHEINTYSVRLFLRRFRFTTGRRQISPPAGPAPLPCDELRAGIPAMAWPRSHAGSRLRRVQSLARAGSLRHRRGIRPIQLLRRRLLITATRPQLLAIRCACDQPIQIGRALRARRVAADTRKVMGQPQRRQQRADAGQETEAGGRGELTGEENMDKDRGNRGVGGTPKDVDERR